jgi:hypothetical protein
MNAQVALIGFDRRISRRKPPLLENRFARNNFHGSIRTGHHATLTADAACLDDLNGIVALNKRSRGTDFCARRVFALPALNGRTDSRCFDHFEPRDKARGSQSFQRIPLGMSQNASYLARAAADAFPRIGNHQYIHLFTC